jgi:crotonobetainyl-CoA:carnitine CoA-transferase CaiB-like acyl-CoA transferase
MADLGADVIKVERPQGDWGRSSGPGHHGGGHHYRALNRNKRNISIDLTQKDATAVAHRLIEQADVMVSAYRPGVTERLGIGYERVRDLNPSLIYVRISAYGQTGSLSGRPGSDTILQAVSGLMSQIGEPSSEPQRVGVPVIDYLASRDAVIGVLCELVGRAGGILPTGPIDISLFASAATLQTHLWQTFFDTGIVQERTGNRNPSLAPAGLYRTSDDRYIAIAVLRNEHFRKLCTALALEDLAVDPRFETNALRLQHRDELESFVTPVFESRPFSEWASILVDHDVLAAPVMSIVDIEADPALRSALPVVYVDVGSGAPTGRAIGSPILINGYPSSSSEPAAGRGAHTRAVLEEIGYDETEIDALVSSQVVLADNRSEE